MENKNCTCNQKTEQKSSFISQNVWLNRLGFAILIIGLGLVTVNNTVMVIIGIIIGLAAIAHLIKLVKGFFKSLWNS